VQSRGANQTSAHTARFSALEWTLSPRRRVPANACPVALVPAPHHHRLGRPSCYACPQRDSSQCIRHANPLCFPLPLPSPPPAISTRSPTRPILISAWSGHMKPEPYRRTRLPSTPHRQSRLQLHSLLFDEPRGPR
jgi:hypothetical protein